MKSRKERVPQNLFLPLIVGIAAAVVGEMLTRGGLIAGYLLPAPSDVLRALAMDADELWRGFLSTALSASVGWFASAVFGFAAALVMSLSDSVRRALMPYAVFFQTVPVIALAPVLVIWFGFGRPTVIASAFIVSIFPVIASTLLGLRSTDALLVELFRSYRARPLTVFWRLRLPAALPAIFGGLRVAAGLAVIGAVVGEFIAGGGLGEVIDAARTQQRLDRVFAAVGLSSALGLIMVSTINVVARRCLRPWHESESGRVR